MPGLFGGGDSVLGGGNQSSMFGGMSFGEKADPTGGFQTLQQSSEQPKVSLDFSSFGSNQQESIFTNPNAMQSKPKVNMSAAGMGNSNSIGASSSMFGSNSFGGGTSSGFGSGPSVSFNALSANKPAETQAPSAPASSSIFGSGSSSFSSFANSSSSSMFGTTSFTSNQQSGNPSMFSQPSEPKPSSTSVFGDSKSSSSMFTKPSGSIFSSDKGNPPEAAKPASSINAGKPSVSIFGDGASSIFSSSATNATGENIAAPSKEEGSIRDVYRARLLKIYSEKNPGKVAKIESFLDKYKGQEHQLYKKVCLKYHMIVKPEYIPGTNASASSALPLAANVQREGESSQTSIFPIEGSIAPAAKPSDSDVLAIGLDISADHLFGSKPAVGPGSGPNKQGSLFSSDAPAKSDGVSIFSPSDKSKDPGSLLNYEKPNVTASKEKVTLTTQKSEPSSLFSGGSLFNGKEGSTSVFKSTSAKKESSADQSDGKQLKLGGPNALARQPMTEEERDIDKGIIAQYMSPDQWSEYAFKRAEEIYLKHSPEKVKNIPKMRAKYKGKECYMLQQICKKNKEPFEMPPYPLRASYGDVCLMPSAFNDGGAYPELFDSQKSQFPPPFNQETPSQAKMSKPAPQAKQGEPSPSPYVSQTILTKATEVETSRPDIFVGAQPVPDKTTSPLKSIFSKKSDLSDTKTSIFSTQTDIFDSRTSLLSAVEPDQLEKKSLEISAAKPSKEPQPKSINWKSSPKDLPLGLNYESSSDEEEQTDKEPEPEELPPPRIKRPEMEKYQDRLRYRVDPASFDIVASSAVEHSFLDAMKFITEQSKKISMYTLQVDDALADFESNQAAGLNESVTKLQQSMKGIVKGTNKNIDGINKVCHIFGDTEAHVAETQRIRDIAKDEKFRKEFDQRPLPKQARRMEFQLREQMQKVSTLMRNIQEKISDRKASESNKLFQLNNNDNLIAVTCNIGRLVQRAVRRTCEVEVKVDLVKGKKNETACTLLLTKPEVKYLSGVYELNAAKPPRLQIPKATTENKLIPISPAHGAMKSPPKRLSSDYVDKMIKSFMDLKAPALKAVPEVNEDTKNSLEDSKFKSPLTVIGKVVPRKYRRRVGALSKLQEKPPVFDYEPPPPPKIVAPPPKPEATEVEKEKKVAFNVPAKTQEAAVPPAAPDVNTQQSGPPAQKEKAKPVAPKAEETKISLFPPSSASEAPSIFGKKPEEPKKSETEAAAKPAQGLFGKKSEAAPAQGLFGKKEEKPAEKTAPSIFGGSNTGASSLFGGNNMFGSSAPAAASSVESGSVTDVYKARLTEIYQAKNPQKVAKVDEFLKKYQGKEHALYMKVCKKYNLTAKPQYNTPGASTTSIFGAQQKPKVNMNAGLQQQASGSSTSLFGNSSGSGLFGNMNNSNNTNNNQSTMFGSSNNSSIFGSNQTNSMSNTNQQQSSMFGNSSNSGVFGSNNQNSSGLFGNSNQQSNSSMFGNNNQQNSGSSMFGGSGMFGNSGSMFGNSNNSSSFNSSNNQQQESGTVQQVYARRLQQIYQKFAPNKIQNIQNLMNKYRGNEHKLYLKVCKKYNMSPMNQYSGGGGMFGNSNSGFGSNQNSGMFGSSNNGSMFGSSNSSMFGSNNNNSSGSGLSGFSSFASGGSVFGGGSSNSHTKFFP